MQTLASENISGFALTIIKFTSNSIKSFCENFMEKSILVTGGTGFLVSHFCYKLIEQGHEVVCVDNYFAGNKGKIEHLLDNPYFQLLLHDVTFPLYIEADEIYNLVYPASLIHYKLNPIQSSITSEVGALIC